MNILKRIERSDCVVEINPIDNIHNNNIKIALNIVPDRLLELSPDELFELEGKEFDNFIKEKIDDIIRNLKGD